MGDLLQFIPRPNPQREANAVEIRNVKRVPPDSPTEYAMNDDTAPAEYVAPDEDGA